MQFVEKISLNRSSRSILTFKSRKRKKKGIYTATTQEKNVPAQCIPKTLRNRVHMPHPKSLSPRVLGLAPLQTAAIKHSSSEK